MGRHQCPNALGDITPLGFRIVGHNKDIIFLLFSVQETTANSKACFVEKTQYYRDQNVSYGVL